VGAGAKWRADQHPKTLARQTGVPVKPTLCGLAASVLSMIESVAVSESPKEKPAKSDQRNVTFTVHEELPGSVAVHVPSVTLNARGLFPPEICSVSGIACVWRISDFPKNQQFATQV
jgi:hypothetical protein